MIPRFTIEVEGQTVFNRGFNRLEQGISDFRNIWPEVTTTIYGIFERAFDTEGASTAAGKWKELTPDYAKRKAIEFPGQTILKAETTMYESLTNPEAADAIFLPERDRLTIGSRDPKARIHQLGLGRQPARPFVSFTEHNKRDIQKSIQRALLQFVRGLGIDVREDRAA